MAISALLFANYASTTGYAWWLMDNFYWEVSQYAQEKGWQCFLAYPLIDGVSARIADAPIQLLSFSLADRSLRNRLRLLNFVWRNGVRYVYLIDQEYRSLFYAFLRLAGVRHIVIHDHTPGDRAPATGLRSAIKKALNWISPINADHVLSVSEYMKKRNVQTARFPDHRCLTVQNGIVPIACAPHEKSTIRRELQIADDVLLVVTSGRATVYKNIEFVIRCAEYLLRSPALPRVEFLYCGSGPDLTRLMALVREKNLQDSFHFLGERNDIRRVLCACDIAIHASRGEGFSLSILEYMSAGLATLVPDVPSVCQSVTHGVDGLVYPSHDFRKAADTICALMLDRELRLRLGREARRKVNASYTLEQCNTAFRELLPRIFPSG